MEPELQEEPDLDTTNPRHPPPRWVRNAAHLLRYEVVETKRRRSGWLVRTTVPGAPHQSFDLEYAGGSFWVTWRQFRHAQVEWEQQLTEPPMTADTAMTVVLTLCNSLRKADGKVRLES